MLAPFYKLVRELEYITTISLLEMEPNDNRQKNSGTSKAAIVGTGIVCSFVGAVIGAVGYYLWKKEDMQRMTHNHEGHTPDKIYNEGTCPICLAEMEELTVLDCGHQYHKTCTKNLKDAESMPKCPICRKKIDK
ncbi:hypothetical protein C0J52_21564 [Blattella germanica]|nr:hypothetical protein C0J52_21564 [Blattella germanica]